MRELTKSLLSFSWVMPLFGVKQAANLALPEDWRRPTEKATRAFESVGEAAEHQLGPWLKQAFDAGDRLQRGTVDLMFGVVNLEAFDPRNWVPSSSSSKTGSGSGGDEPQGGSGGGESKGKGWGPVS